MCNMTRAESARGALSCTVWRVQPIILFAFVLVFVWLVRKMNPSGKGKRMPECQTGNTIDGKVFWEGKKKEKSRKTKRTRNRKKKKEEKKERKKERKKEGKKAKCEKESNSRQQRSISLVLGWRGFAFAFLNRQESLKIQSVLTNF